MNTDVSPSTSLAAKVFFAAVALVGAIVVAGIASAGAERLLEATGIVGRHESELSALRHEVDELRTRLDDLQRPTQPPAAPRPRPDPDVAYTVPVDGSPVRGPRDAPVTIVAFTDYECPFCARAEATLAQLQQRFPGDVRVVVKHNPLPFHQNAKEAAVAASCAFLEAGDSRFFDLHDRLFAAARSRVIDKLLGDEGQSSAQRACRESGRAQALVERDMALAKELGATGTPTFFINGRVLTGAQPLDAFVTRVEAELHR
jgi:protein-disulfide isomerase